VCQERPRSTRLDSRCELHHRTLAHAVAELDLASRSGFLLGRFWAQLAILDHSQVFDQLVNWDLEGLGKAQKSRHRDAVALLNALYLRQVEVMLDDKRAQRQPALLAQLVDSLSQRFGEFFVVVSQHGIDVDVDLSHFDKSTSHRPGVAISTKS